MDFVTIFNTAAKDTRKDAADAMSQFQERWDEVLVQLVGNTASQATETGEEVADRLVVAGDRTARFVRRVAEHAASTVAGWGDRLGDRVVKVDLTAHRD